MQSYINLEIIFLLLLVISCFGVIAWIFRPNSEKRYEEYSKIPLKDDED